MNLWIIAAIVIGLLAITVVTVSNLSSADETEVIECIGCGNACNANSNCGLSSCGAVSGGSCGCGR